MRFRTRTPVLLFSAALSLGVFSSSAGAQQLVGRAFDGLSGQPVAGVDVTVLDETGEPVGLAASDSAGAFATRLPGPGTYHLLATAAGYAPLAVDSVTVGVREAVRIEIRLGPRPFDVEELRVVTRRVERPGLEELYERLERHEKTGRGVVLDREDLERYPGASGASALARASLRIQEVTRPGGGVIMKRLARAPPWCAPAIFLDGMLVDAFTLQSMPASTLAGIEMYRGILEVPAQYGWAPGADCGVILAWTRMQGRTGVEGVVRPFRVGGYLTVVAGEGDELTLEAGGYGAEAELGVARALVAWLEVGLLPSRQPLCYTSLVPCEDRPRGWSVVLGGGVFPTGEDLWLSPFVGLGLGIDVRSGEIERVHVLRLGVELPLSFMLVRIEARGGSQGWGIGTGVLF